MRNCVHGILLMVCLVSPAWGQDVRIYCDQKVERIKPGLAGVAQGGNADSYLKPQVVESLRGLKIKTVRLEAVTCNQNYTLYDPATKAYSWANLDREIEAIQASGAEIVFDLFCTPHWLSSDPEGKRGPWFYAGARDLKAWSQYVRQIVKHVNVDKKYGIRYFEVWNEPSGAWFFTDWKLGKEHFWELYGVTAKAIKSADPAALVGGFADNMNYPNEYKDFFEYAKARGIPIDFLTLHWYAEWTPDGKKRPELYYMLSQSIRRLHRAHFGKDVPMIITEWNLDAEYVNSTFIQQAAFMGSSLYWLQESPIQRACFFRVEDYKGMHRSVLNDQFEWLAPARVLAMFTMLPEHRISVCDEPAGVTVLAGRDSRRVAAMVSRYDHANPACKIAPKMTFLHHEHKGPYTITVYQEDAKTAGKPGKLVPTSVAKGTADGQAPITATLELENFSVGLVVVDLLPER